MKDLDHQAGSDDQSQVLIKYCPKLVVSVGIYSSSLRYDASDALEAIPTYPDRACHAAEASKCARRRAGLTSPPERPTLREEVLSRPPFFAFIRPLNLEGISYIEGTLEAHRRYIWRYKKGTPKEYWRYTEGTSKARRTSARRPVEDPSKPRRTSGRMEERERGREGGVRKGKCPHLGQIIDSYAMI